MADDRGVNGNRFGVLLRQLREARGLTQQKLADASRISVRAIQDLESGRTRNPQFHTTSRLADALTATATQREALSAAARPPAESGIQANAAAEPEQVDPHVVDQADPPAQHDARTSRGKVRAMAMVAGAVIIVVLGWLGLRELTSASAGPNDVTPGAAPHSRLATTAPKASPPATSSVASKSPLVTITSPRDGAAVPGDDLEVHGTASLPTGTELWLLVHPEHGDPGFWGATPKPITIDASGGWAARITIGRGPRDAGYKFRLIAVVSPVHGGVQRHVTLLPKGKRYPKMDSIPPDCIAAAEVRVTRAK